MGGVIGLRIVTGNGRFNDVVLCDCSVTDKSATAFLSVAGKERWKARGTVKTVVLVDDHSTSEMLSQQDTGQRPLPILALKDALYKVR